MVRAKFLTEGLLLARVRAESCTLVMAGYRFHFTVQRSIELIDFFLQLFNICTSLEALNSRRYCSWVNSLAFFCFFSRRPFKALTTTWTSSHCSPAEGNRIGVFFGRQNIACLALTSRTAFCNFFLWSALTRPFNRLIWNIDAEI